jgi:hypothetical protein
VRGEQKGKRETNRRGARPLREDGYKDREDGYHEREDGYEQREAGRTSILRGTQFPPPYPDVLRPVTLWEEPV